MAYVINEPCIGQRVVAQPPSLCRVGRAMVRHAAPAGTALAWHLPSM